MKIAIVGIGGIGGFVGGALLKQGADVAMIARGVNLAAIRENGLTVESVLLGEFTVRPPMITDNPEEVGVVDAVIFSTKGQQLEQACRQAAPMIGPDTLVVPLLNGIEVSSQMEPFLPPCDLADGCIRVFSHIAQPGLIRQTAGKCQLPMGKKDGSKSEKLEELVHLLCEAGLQARMAEDIRVECWSKYLLMGGNSVAFCHFDGPAGVVLERDPELNFLRQTYGELVAVATALGVTLPEGLAERCVEEFAKHSYDTISSLYRDVSSGKDPLDTELLHIIGRMVDLGKQCGVPTPCHSGVLEQLLPK